VRVSFHFHTQSLVLAAARRVFASYFSADPPGDRGAEEEEEDFKRGFQKLFVFNDTIEGPWASVTNAVRSAALQDFGSDMGFFYKDMKERAVHFHDQPTVLYWVPTNPGPRSFCARPVYWCRCARPLAHFLNCPKGKSPQLPKFTNPNPRYNPEIPNFQTPECHLTIPSSTSRRPRRDMPQLEPK